MAEAVPRSQKDEAERLARLVGDPERLLAGEEPGTSDLEVARNWMRVHRQLLEVRTELLEHLRKLQAGVSDPAVAAGLKVNARGLALSVERSRARYSYWESRVAALEADLATTVRA
jgi:hypothetical protein